MKDLTRFSLTEFFSTFQHVPCRSAKIMIDFRGHHSLKRLQFMRYRLVNTLPGKYGLQQIIQQKIMLDKIVIYCFI